MAENGLSKRALNSNEVISQESLSTSTYTKMPVKKPSSGTMKINQKSIQDTGKQSWLDTVRAGIETTRKIIAPYIEGNTSHDHDTGSDSDRDINDTEYMKNTEEIALVEEHERAKHQRREQRRLIAQWMDKSTASSPGDITIWPKSVKNVVQAIARSAPGTPDRKQRQQLCDTQNAKVVDNIKNDQVMQVEMIVESELVHGDILRDIVRLTPVRYQLVPWTCIYSMTRHGSSCNTLFEKCQGYAVSVIIIKTFDNDIFGGFTSEPWRKKTTYSESGYYGSAECFCFKVVCDGSKMLAKKKEAVIETSTNQSQIIPGTNSPSNSAGSDSHLNFKNASSSAETQLLSSRPVPWQSMPQSLPFSELNDPSANTSSYHIFCYRASGANELFMFTNDEALGMGGGKDFAFEVDRNLFLGTSGACETFDSPQLTRRRQFEVCSIELWGPLPAEQADALLLN